MAATDVYRPCPGCGNAIPYRTITTNLPGTVSVEMVVCRICDRRKCHVCETYVQDPHAKQCGNGHWLFGT